MNDNKCRNCGKDIVVAIFKGGDWCSDNCRKVLEHGAVKTAVITRTFASDEEELEWALELVRRYNQNESEPTIKELTSVTNMVVAYRVNVLGVGSVATCAVASETQEELELWAQTAAERNFNDVIYFFRKDPA